jgi:GT2 family glycosyltransferase
MESVFYLFAFIVFAQSLLALAAALRFARYSLRAPSARHRYQPKAVVIVPCKGLDLNFEENIGTLFAQDYRDYELIFVTESEADPAYAALSHLIEQSRRSAWLVVAGRATNCGQKVHNLCAALETLDAVNRRAEIIAFADSDARVSERWLAELVAPLAEDQVGATTGFRWYLPVEGKRTGFFSLPLSVWNASVLGLMGEKSALAWGGAMAVRRENFERLGIREHWAGALSDDYALTTAVKAAGQQIRFVPACLVTSFADATLKELLEFTTRQMTITRIYAPGLWRLTAITHLLYNLALWGGAVFLFNSAVQGEFKPALAGLLGGILFLGAMTGAVRALVAARLLEEDQHQIAGNWWAWLCLGPFVSLVFLYNLAASSLTRRISWRGIDYEMLSPRRTLILHRDQAPGSHEPAHGIPAESRASAHSSSSELR